MAMLWLKCTELIPVVKEQLEAATGELVRGTPRKTDLDMYLSVESSTDPAVIELGKIDCLKQSKEMLSSIGAALVHKCCRRSQ